MNKNLEHSSDDDFPLNPVIITAVAFVVGAGMSVYFTLSGDLGIESLLIMLGLVAVICFAVWSLINFIKRSGRKDSLK